MHPPIEQLTDVFCRHCGAFKVRGRTVPMPTACGTCGFTRCICGRPAALISETVFAVCPHDGAPSCRCSYCAQVRQACRADAHAFNAHTAKRIVELLANTPPVMHARIICAAIDQAELRGRHDGTAGVCPGEWICFSRGGSNACRVHGCRACGAAVLLADADDWPAPLCAEHAPEEVFRFWESLADLLARVVEAFDGIHNPDCIAWTIAQGQPLSDATLETHARGQTPCSCGAFELRNRAREKLGSRSIGASVVAELRKGRES